MVIITQTEGIKVEEYISAFNTATIKTTIAENNDAERNEELVNPWTRKRVFSMGTLVI